MRIDDARHHGAAAQIVAGGTRVFALQHCARTDGRYPAIPEKHSRHFRLARITRDDRAADDQRAGICGTRVGRAGAQQEQQARQQGGAADRGQRRLNGRDHWAQVPKRLGQVGRPAAPPYPEVDARRAAAWRSTGFAGTPRPRPAVGMVFVAASAGLGPVAFGQRQARRLGRQEALAAAGRGARTAVDSAQHLDRVPRCRRAARSAGSSVYGHGLVHLTRRAAHAAALRVVPILLRLF